MGMFDSVWFKNAKGEDVEIQFKCGERYGTTYEIGDNIPLPDGVFFGWEGAFVVSSGKVVAAFESDSDFMFTKWGDQIPYPESLR